MGTGNRALAIITACLAAGCAAHPQLEQIAVDSDAAAVPNAYESYTLQSSEVTLKLVNNSIGFDNAVVDAKNNVLFQIFLDDPFYQTTVLSVAKRPGTSTISNAGVFVVDDRKDLIQAAGTILATAVRFGAAGSGTNVASLPLRFRVDSLLNKPIRNAYDIESDSDHQGVQYRVGPVSHDAVPLADILARGRHRFDGLYFSACRDLEVVVTYDTARQGSDAGETHRDTVHVKVADANFVTPRQFPNNGSIISHDGTCSTSTTRNTPGGTPLAGIAASLAAQIQALENASKGK
jgi:hypothetical protein